MPDEETIWTGHPSHWHYFWAWVLGVVLFAAVIGIGIIIWIFIDRSRRTYIGDDRIGSLGQEFGRG